MSTSKRNECGIVQCMKMLITFFVKSLSFNTFYHKVIMNIHRKEGGVFIEASYNFFVYDCKK